MIRGARRDRWIAVAGGIALLGASVALFFVSRGKWSDAIIDSGREWIVPDALARGELLYRDVVYWFGPFTPYFHAAFFRLFGSSFATLVLAGVVGSAGVLAALYFGLRTVTRRQEAALWTALAVPALVFMPNAGGSILGMGYRIWHAAAFALAAIALAVRLGEDRRPTPRVVSVGLLCALSGLCRIEWGLVALASSAFALWFRKRPESSRLRDIFTLFTAFLVLVGGTMAAFVAAAGWKAVVDDGHVLLTGLPSETREFLIAFSGIRDWRNGLLELVYSAAMWTGIVFLLHLLAIRPHDHPRVRRRLPLLLSFFLTLGVSAALGGVQGAFVFSAAPLVCVVSVFVGLARRGVLRPALIGFGVAGALLSYRRPFHIADSAYVGPPLLIALICSAGLIQFVLDRENEEGVRKRFRKYLQSSVIVIIVIAFGSRTLRYSADERLPIPGTDGMLSARPELSAAMSRLSSSIGRITGAEAGLVVFPEGEVLNLLAGRSNPLRYKLYIPGYLSRDNESGVIAEFEKWNPEVVVIRNRPTGEYGAGTFGLDYGVRIARTMDQRYERCETGERLSAASRQTVLLVRKGIACPPDQ